MGTRLGVSVYTFEKCAGVATDECNQECTHRLIVECASPQERST